MTNAAIRFDAWVDYVGGTGKAAIKLGFSPAYISLIRHAKRTPGRALAVNIQRRTQKWGKGPIRVTAWDR